MKHEKMKLHPYPSLEHARAEQAKRPQFDRDVERLLEMVGVTDLDQLPEQAACTLVWLSGWDHTTMVGLQALFNQAAMCGFDEGCIVTRGVSK